MFIIATVEKYLLTQDRIKKMLLAGADVIRFNFSYRTIEENINFIAMAQQAIDDLNASAKILIDFPLNKFRLGDFEAKFLPVNENDEIIFKSGTYVENCQDGVPVQVPNLGEKLQIGQTITIGDGEISVQVIEIIDKESARVRVLNKGLLQYMKTFHIFKEIEEEKILQNYADIIRGIKHINPYYFAISYFNPQLLERIIELIYKEDINPKIILRIENEMDENELEKICQTNNFHMILIDRGELGVNMPYYKTGTHQKKIIAIAKKYNKPVIISTHILESAMNNYIPNRAEILDITNSVIDGVEGLMLCRETATNVRPAYIISVAKKIIAEAEKFKNQTSQT
ncbi:MAG: pyruvate kinase [Patescibacteria group bacterium]